MLSACTSNTTQVTNFDECIAAGNPVMESYPRQCTHEGQTFQEVIGSVGAETPAEQACTKEFVPVCGEIEVQCIKAPCPPIKTTFQNKCEAENAGAKNIKEGACVDEVVNLQGACLSFDGNWLEATQECEGMGQEMCDDLGGTYNECASACRNNPDAELCTMQCVQVCKF